MPLFVIATPIGNPKDFTLRALEILRTADLIIGEEPKALRQILKAAGVQAKATDQLNEHSDSRDIEHLSEACRDQTVALVSDCGTPGFSDPGAELVAACARKKITTTSVPGPSSLMALLSVAGVRLDQFLFMGFLPAKKEERSQAWEKLQRQNQPTIIMETPYRTSTLIKELKAHTQNCVLGWNLTQENEQILRGHPKDWPELNDGEVICLLLPVGGGSRGAKLR